MLQISADILGMSNEAALLAKGSKIIYANSAACSILGSDCAEKTLKVLFGNNISEIQAGSFLADTTIGGKNYILRVITADGIKAIFLTPHRSTGGLLNDAFIYHLRNSLMTVESSLNSMREALYYSKDLDLHNQLMALTLEAFKINRMVSNVSLLYNLEKGEHFFGPRWYDIASAMHSLVNSVLLLPDAPNILLSMPKELMIYADPDMISTLVFNLLSNAIRHAEGCSRIKLSVHEYTDSILITVDDDGCGIPQSEFGVVFDRFCHEFGFTDMGKGTGLGLTVARSIARMHNGILMLESREGAGTTVRVTLEKKSRSHYKMKEPEEDYKLNMRSVLTGLADCLPVKCFSDQFLDL